MALDVRIIQAGIIVIPFCNPHTVYTSIVYIIYITLYSIYYILYILYIRRKLILAERAQSILESCNSIVYKIVCFVVNPTVVRSGPQIVQMQTMKIQLERQHCIVPVGQRRMHVSGDSALSASPRRYSRCVTAFFVRSLRTVVACGCFHDVRANAAGCNTPRVPYDWCLCELERKEFTV